MNYSIELDKYGLNVLKSLVRAEYQKMQICFTNQSQDDFGKDIIKDSMIRLKHIQGKLDNVITRVDNITDDVSILGKRKYSLFGRK